MAGPFPPRKQVAPFGCVLFVCVVVVVVVVVLCGCCWCCLVLLLLLLLSYVVSCAAVALWLCVCVCMRAGMSVVTLCLRVENEDVHVLESPCVWALV